MYYSFKNTWPNWPNEEPCGTFCCHWQREDKSLIKWQKCSIILSTRCQWQHDDPKVKTSSKEFKRTSLSSRHAEQLRLVEQSFTMTIDTDNDFHIKTESNKSIIECVVKLTFDLYISRNTLPFDIFTPCFACREDIKRQCVPLDV